MIEKRQDVLIKLGRDVWRTAPIESWPDNPSMASAASPHALGDP
jgi:hypothetical protein